MHLYPSREEAKRPVVLEKVEGCGGDEIPTLKELIF